MTEQNWNETIKNLPGANILQTSQWAEIKSVVGWTPFFKTWKNESGEVVAAALILEKVFSVKKIRTGLRFFYIPRGPLLDWNDDVLRTRVMDDIAAFAKSRHAIFIKMDPDIPTGFGVPGTETYRENAAGQALLKEYRSRGWIFSRQQIQFRNSVWIDVTPSEEDLLARMKQRTRYKVRLAEKKGVTVREGTSADFDLLADMYAETSARDGFIIRDKAYYLNVWNHFLSAGMLVPLIAETDGDAVGAVMLFSFGEKSWYIYGMSRDLHREKMPNYLLQWKAICASKARGCRIYDLWGAPDEFIETDRMWNVYQFKSGLGGYEVLSPGAYDLPINKPLYHLFEDVMPKFTAILRRRKGISA